MPLEIAAPEAVVSASYARWAIYGLNGTGKTTFLSSIPRSVGPVLVASVGVENVKPLLGHPHIQVVKIREWADLFELISNLRKGLEDPRVRSGEKPFWKVLAFDTWTRLQGVAAKSIAGWKPPTDIQDLQRVLMQAPKTPRGFEAWQQIGELSNQWIDYFEQLPIHLVFLFQEELRTPTAGAGEKAIQTGPTKIGPMLTPAAVSGVMNSTELVGRLYVEIDGEEVDLDEDGLTWRAAGRRINPAAKEVRRLLIGQHHLYRTKGPTARLGYVVTDPTWEKLAASLEPEQEEE